MNVTNEADKYMVQKILEKIPEIVENPEILARFDDKSQAFLKESYAKDIKMERTFEKEGSPSWKKASAEAEKTKNPIKNFSNKIKRGIINFFVKAGYIEEFDDGKEEPARQSENKNSEDPKSNAQTSEQRRKKETYKEQTNERQQEEQSASEKAENETADKENDNSEETETKSDEEKDEKKQDLSEEERQKQREKFKEQAKKVKERAEKDLNEYEKTKANSETKSDFDFYMNEVLIDMLDESIKIKLFDRRRIEPKYFGTDEEYKTKYDFFAKRKRENLQGLSKKFLWKRSRQEKRKRRKR